MSRRRLPAAVFLPVLAACTSTAGRPGPGTGTAGTSAGSGPAAPGGLRAVGTRSMEFSELPNMATATNPLPSCPTAAPRLVKGVVAPGRFLLIASDGAIVGRPDRFIAWRSPAAASDPRAVLTAVLSQTLGRTLFAEPRSAGS